MSNKNKIASRTLQKIDTSENWSKAAGFIPLEGEIIVYKDLNKIKIGDGVTNVNSLRRSIYEKKNDQDPALLPDGNIAVIICGIRSGF